MGGKQKFLGLHAKFDSTFSRINHDSSHEDKVALTEDIEAIY